MRTSHASPGVHSGALFAIGAYATWGFVPLFWRELTHIPPVQILAHRIVWSVVFFLAIFLVQGRIKQWLFFCRSPESISKSLPSALAIGVNWGLYIYAVNSGHALESSLGYFINPIFNVLIGAFVFREKLNNFQWSAFSLATCGVLLMTFANGRPPWIALSLASTFCLYGVIRKKTELQGSAGTALESVILLPVAALILSFSELSPVNLVEISPPSLQIKTALLLGFGGALTAMPLVWFAEAAQRMPLSILGFFQYISPTLQFLIAVFVFGEEFNQQKFFAFLFIWSGLAVLIFDSLRRLRRSRMS